MSTIQDVVYKLIETDFEYDEKEESIIVEAFEKSKDKAAINNIFISLTGHSLATIINEKEKLV